MSKVPLIVLNLLLTSDARQTPVKGDIKDFFDILEGREKASTPFWSKQNGFRLRLIKRQLNLRFR